MIDGSKPSMKAPKITEALVPDAETPMTCLRITIPLAYVPKTRRRQLREYPQSCLQLVGVKGAYKTYRWTSASGCISGYIQVPDKEIEEFLKTSGKEANFFSRLSRDVLNREAATWVDKTIDEAKALHGPRPLRRRREFSFFWVFWVGGGGNNKRCSCYAT